MLDKLNPKIMVLIAVVFVSFSAILAKMSNAPALVLASFRLGFTVLILLPSVIKSNISEIKRVDKRNLTLCIISGIFLALHLAAWISSVKYTSIASAAVLVNTHPIFIVLGSYFLFKEKTAKKVSIGILVTFIGCVIVSIGDSTLGTNILLGDILAVSGAILITGYFMIGRIVRQMLSVNTYTFLVYTSGFITLMILSFITKTPLYPYPVREVLIGLGMAVLCTILGHSIFNWALQYVKATFVSTATLGEPVGATIWAMLLFQEFPTLWQIGGSLVIIFGIYLYGRFSNEEEKRVKLKTTEKIV